MGVVGFRAEIPPLKHLVEFVDQIFAVRHKDES